MLYKKLFFIFIFVVTTLTLTQFTAADYTITNGSTTETAYVIYSAWRSASSGWPAGWRTRGYYEVEPGGTRNLFVPEDNTLVYIRVERAGKEIKPTDHATRDSSPFWIHPSQAFTVVETNAGDFLKSNHGKWSLERADLYEYRNGGSHTIVDEPRLPDRPSQEIYDEAINSVVWIQTHDGNESYSKGSGVLIDKTRRLVVTNAHVIDNAAFIYVFFPWRDQDQNLNKDEDFYFENWDWLESRSYASTARVITQNVKNDVAIIQLDQLSPDAREIEHDFSKNLEDSMRQGDTVHILGNPGNRLWNWTRGIFSEPQQWCLPVPGKGDCLVLEADVHGGNSGGPVLNGQGKLIGILAAGTDETIGAAVPTRNIISLLDTVQFRHTVKIRNTIGFTVRYQIKWSWNQNWEQTSLMSGYIRTHPQNEENVSPGYPKIRFDHITGDQQVTWRVYTLSTSLQFGENNDNAPIYYFQYNRWNNKLYLFQDAAAAPVLSRETPEETTLLANYPNPFNPETWIPYQLSKPAEITISIYSADGKLIRRLVLGHQPAGVYQSKSRAAYWDGRNAQGEPVASGVYFYTLRTDDFSVTRKMLIRK